jgi:hypothetical protein
MTRFGDSRLVRFENTTSAKVVAMESEALHALVEQARIPSSARCDRNTAIPADTPTKTGNGNGFRRAADGRWPTSSTSSVQVRTIWTCGYCGTRRVGGHLSTSHQRPGAGQPTLSPDDAVPCADHAALLTRRPSSRCECGDASAGTAAGTLVVLAVVMRRSRS